MEAIEVGDRLIAVDEVDVRQMTPTKVSKLISKRSSNPMRKLTLLRSKNPEITIVFEKDGKSPVSSKGGTSPV
jgi:C-terminal processing protease CtpA/Prc